MLKRKYVPTLDDVYISDRFIYDILYIFFCYEFLDGK